MIFICPFDLFGYDKYRYTFRMTCDEVPGLSMDDGAVKIFLNTHGQNEEEVSEELVELLHYMENSANYSAEFVSPRVKQLAKQVDDIKSNQEVSVKYMRMLEELNDARAEGREEGEFLKVIKLIRDNLLKGCSMEIIANFLGEKLEIVELIGNILQVHPDKADDEIFELVKDHWSDNSNN